MTSNVLSQVNAELFQRLEEPETVVTLADAINAFVRAKLRERGLMHRLMGGVLFSREKLDRFGIPLADCSVVTAVGGPDFYQPWWNESGETFEELLLSLTKDATFVRKYNDRTLTRDEWMRQRNFERALRYRNVDVKTYYENRLKTWQFASSLLATISEMLIHGQEQKA